jgi:uncharacterized protein
MLGFEKPRFGSFRVWQACPPGTARPRRAVEAGEEALRALGFRQLRTRFHGELVRIEIAPDEIERALTPAMAARFVAIFKPLGFHYVTLDLEGYRQGALNESLGLASAPVTSPKALP